MKKCAWIIGLIVSFVIILFISLVLIMPISKQGDIYETNDLADYGEILGNYDNNTPAEFIAQFFPKEISSSFTDVSYHYSARKGDSYAYECYLEFEIKDTDAFNSFLMQYEEQYEATIFDWDTRFMEYSVSNVFDTDWTSKSDEKGYPIQYARIGKVLYSQDDQRIIFWALGVWDGGEAGTAHLHHFFDRFQIAILDYQMKAYVFEKDQEAGITYQDRYENNMPTFYPYPEGN